MYEHTGEEPEFYLDLERQVLEAARRFNADLPECTDPTSVSYEIGNSVFGRDHLRLFFMSLYAVLFQRTDGPRLGDLIEIMGVEMFLRTLNRRLNEIDDS